VLLEVHEGKFKSAPLNRIERRPCGECRDLCRLNPYRKVRNRHPAGQPSSSPGLKGVSLLWLPSSCFSATSKCLVLRLCANPRLHLIVSLNRTSRTIVENSEVEAESSHKVVGFPPSLEPILENRKRSSCLSLETCFEFYQDNSPASEGQPKSYSTPGMKILPSYPNKNKKCVPPH
jgi:hypothetical protein